MKEQIKTTMSNVLGVDIKDIDTHSNRESIPGWDSLKHMEFIVSIENRFEITLMGDEIAALRTIRDVKSQIIAKGAGNDA